MGRVGSASCLTDVLYAFYFNDFPESDHGASVHPLTSGYRLDFIGAGRLTPAQIRSIITADVLALW